MARWIRVAAVSPDRPPLPVAMDSSTRPQLEAMTKPRAARHAISINARGALGNFPVKRVGPVIRIAPVVDGTHIAPTMVRRGSCRGHQCHGDDSQKNQ
jgi:hypothetical protein